MGVRCPSAGVNGFGFIGPLPANANETIVFTTPPIITPLDGAVVLVAWCCDITAGVGVTRHIFLVRRGNNLAAGNILVGGGLVTAQAAGLRSTGAGAYFDTLAGGQPTAYTLTVQQTGATGAGAFNDGALIAFVL